MNTILSFFQPSSIPVYPPYYEISDKNGKLVGCLSGTHHELAPNTRFEPAPAMQKCLTQSTTLLVEADKEAIKKIVRRSLLQEGFSARSIDESFREAERKENSMDIEWEKRAKLLGKPIKGLESPINALNAAIKIAQENEITPEKERAQCSQWMNSFLIGYPVKTKDYFQHCFIDKDRTIKEFIVRNEVMASGIDHSIRTRQLPFIAVGLGHCLGDRGVPQLLRERYGWNVREIDPEPSSFVHTSTKR